MKTQTLLQFGCIQTSDTVIDYTQNHSLSGVFQFHDNFARLSVFIGIDDRFACDAKQVRCGRIVINPK